MKQDIASTTANGSTSNNQLNGLRPEIRLIIEAIVREAVVCERAQTQAVLANNSQR
jgi:hypothetical protein